MVVNQSRRFPPYAEAVPAVVRALDVLEHLASAPSGRTLSQIGRALQISPSSLLAILRTLAQRGYVQRDAATGAYRLGDRLGRFAVAEGDRRTIEQAATAVTALGQALLATAAEPGHVERRDAVLQALGFAGQRLSALLLGAVARADAGSSVPSPVWQVEASGPLSPAELEQFLASDRLATLSCLSESGYPYSVPVWYLWESGCFWVVPRARAEWARYLDRNPRVSLAISESQPPLRRVLVEGLAEPLAGPGSAERARGLSARLAARYLGPSAGSYLEATDAVPRRAIAIVPTRLVTWRGLAPHPRYQTSHHRASDDQGVA